MYVFRRVVLSVVLLAFRSFLRFFSLFFFFFLFFSFFRYFLCFYVLPVAHHCMPSILTYIYTPDFAVAVVTAGIASKLHSKFG